MIKSLPLVLLVLGWFLIGLVLPTFMKMFVRRARLIFAWFKNPWFPIPFTKYDWIFPYTQGARSMIWNMKEGKGRVADVLNAKYTYHGWGIIEKK